MSYKSYEDIKFEIVDGIERHENFWEFKNMKQSELVGYHRSLGSQIRHLYKLWSPDNPLTQGYATDPSKHPDQVSLNLITDVWKHFNKL